VRDRGVEHKAHQADAPLWSDEEHVQKSPGAPKDLGVPEPSHRGQVHLTICQNLAIFFPE